MGRASELVCSRCSLTYDPGKPVNLCSCGGPILVRYDLANVRQSWSKKQLESARPSMWRYEPVLPCGADEAVTLQEGWTPLKKADSLGKAIGLANLWIKDEGRNPTDSFKARGLSCAVSMAKKFGLQKLAIPSAGNAAGALAAYAAAGGLEAHIFMPTDVPQANFIECKAFGAKVNLVN